MADDNPDAKDKVKAFFKRLGEGIKSRPFVFIAGIVVGFIACKIISAEG